MSEVRANGYQLSTWDKFVSANFVTSNGGDADLINRLTDGSLTQIVGWKNEHAGVGDVLFEIITTEKVHVFDISYYSEFLGPGWKIYENDVLVLSETQNKGSGDRTDAFYPSVLSSPTTSITNAMNILTTNNSHVTTVTLNTGSVTSLNDNVTLTNVIDINGDVNPAHASNNVYIYSWVSSQEDNSKQSVVNRDNILTQTEHLYPFVPPLASDSSSFDGQTITVNGATIVESNIIQFVDQKIDKYYMFAFANDVPAQSVGYSHMKLHVLSNHGSTGYTTLSDFSIPGAVVSSISDTASKTGHPVSRMVDGDPNTYHQTTQLSPFDVTMTFESSLPSSFTATFVSIWNDQGWKDVDMYVSTDGTSWTLVKKFRGTDLPYSTYEDVQGRTSEIAVTLPTVSIDASTLYQNFVSTLESDTTNQITSGFFSDITDVDTSDIYNVPPVSLQRVFVNDTDPTSSEKLRPAKPSKSSLWR